MVDSLVVVEDFGEQKIYYYSRGCFRVAWHLGGLYSILGILSFLPQLLLFPFDLIYRLVARNRRKFCDLGVLKEDQVTYSDRFLP